MRSRRASATSAACTTTSSSRATLPPTEIVPAALQRDVLGLLMEAIEPANMVIPETLLAQLTPSPVNNLEDLAYDYAFDHLRAARILSAMVLEPLLAPARAARLVAFADRQTGALTLPEVIDAGPTRTWRASADTDPKTRSLRRVAERVALDSMMIRRPRGHDARGARLCTGPDCEARRIAAGAEGRQPADRRALSPGGARHHPVSRGSDRQRPEERHARVGRPSAVALSPAAGSAARVSGTRLARRTGRRLRPSRGGPPDCHSARCAVAGSNAQPQRQAAAREPRRRRRNCSGAASHTAAATRHTGQ